MAKRPKKPAKKSQARRAKGAGTVPQARRAKGDGDRRAPKARRAAAERPPPAEPEQILTPAEPLFDASERAAWKPREKIKPSEWAERYRVLSGDQSIFATGPYRYENAPYLRAVSDLPAAPGVVQINAMKSPQVGFSEAIRNFIGWRADTDPAPIGLTLPDKLKGESIVAKNLIPLFKETEQLQQYVSERLHDIKLSEIRLLNGFRLHLMWSGSKSSMAAHPMLDVFNDEVDKFSVFRFADADAVDLTGRRQLTGGGRGIQVNISTPTDRLGNIFLLFDASSIKLYFFVPCPFCGCMQRLVFDQLKYDPKLKTIEDKEERATALIKAAAVWYECSECGKHITEDQRPAMVRAGAWGTLDQSITDAETVGEWPRGTRIGLHIWQAYTLWDEHNWTNIMAEWIRARGDRIRSYAFKTQVLGEPFEDQVHKSPKTIFTAKIARATLPEGIIPAWALIVIAAVDTQRDYFFYVIRAWGPGKDMMRSQRVLHGRAESFDELHRICFNTPIKVEAEAHPPQTCHILGIDSGGTRLEGEDVTRTMQVYQWVRRRMARVRALKGATKSLGGHMFRQTKGILRLGETKKQTARQKLEVPLWLVDTHMCGDYLAEMIHTGIEGDLGHDDEPVEEVWLLNKRDDEEYNSHMSNIMKAEIKRPSGVEEFWVPTSAGARVDYWDCEVYQIALAHIAKVHLLPSSDEYDTYRAAADAKRQAAVRGKSNLCVETDQSRRRNNETGSGFDITPLE